MFSCKAGCSFEKDDKSDTFKSTNLSHFPCTISANLNTAGVNRDRYVYVPTFESGGSFFPKMFRRWIFALFTAQATMVGMCLLKQGFKQAYSVMFLMVLTYVYKVSSSRVLHFFMGGGALRCVDAARCFCGGNRV